jgi:hypothetical protein
VQKYMWITGITCVDHAAVYTNPSPLDTLRIGSTGREVDIHSPGAVRRSFSSRLKSADFLAFSASSRIFVLIDMLFQITERLFRWVYSFSPKKFE